MTANNHPYTQSNATYVRQQPNTQSTGQQPTNKQQVGQKIGLRATGFSNNNVTGGD